MEADQTVVSFGYPVILHKSTLPVLFEQHKIQPASGDMQSIKALVKQWLDQLSLDVTKNVKCQIFWSSFDPSVIDLEDGRVELMYGVTVVGAIGQLFSARAALLKNRPSQILKQIQLSHSSVLDSNARVKPFVSSQLKQLSKETRTIILVNGHLLNDDFSNVLESATVSLQIYGGYEAVHRATHRMYSLADEWNGNFVATVDIDHRLHMLIGGRSRQEIIKLMRETCTKIYIPSTFVRKPPQEAANVKQDQKLVYVTGQSANVEQAVNQLMQLAAQKEKILITKNLTCLPKKIDWMLTSKRDHLYKLMYENGTFIQFPMIGVNSNLVTVYGDSSVYVERTIRNLMLIACEYYVSCIQLVPTSRLGLSKESKPSFTDLSSICLNSRTELVFQKTFIEIYGLEVGVKKSYQLLTAEPSIAQLIKDTKFQIELGLEHKEFIMGKKNGKINKITKQVGCKIQFQEQFNDYNMLIDMYHPSPAKALEALALLEDELPAEISFYVNEMFHKRIIGVGGKNIQRIMKKHGVYVKFSNSEEFSSLGGYYNSNDNVIARTPSKNAENLYELKKDVLELVDDEQDQFTKIQMSLPFELFSFVGNAEIDEIATRTGCKIIFNDVQLDSGEFVEIEGNEAAVYKAKSMIEALIPSQLHFKCQTKGQIDTAILAEFLSLLSTKHQMQAAFYHPPSTSVYYFTMTFIGDSLHLSEIQKEIQGFVAANEQSTDKDAFIFNLFGSTTQAADVGSGFNYSLFDKGLGATGKLTYSVPDLRQVFDEKKVFNEPALFPEQPDHIGILTETLGATSIDESPLLAASVDHLTLQTDEPPRQFSPASKSQNAFPSSGSVWGKFNVSLADQVQLKTPSDRYCGLSMSRSMPDGLNESAKQQQPQQPLMQTFNQPPLIQPPGYEYQWIDQPSAWLNPPPAKQASPLSNTSPSSDTKTASPVAYYDTFQLAPKKKK